MANQNYTRVKVPNSIITSPGADIDLQRSHDALPRNPDGRDKSDEGACRRRNLVNCKKVITISTMNVRTIREQQCREELVSNLIEYNVEVLGIQEHRIIHDEPIRYEDILGRTLITTSATKNDAGAAVGGGNPATTVIVTYCPTNVADEDIVENHYDSMRRAIESIPAHNLLIVMGDFNARVGLEDTKFTYHDTTNRNGKYLVELATEKNLIIANTQFRKKAGKLWTFTSPGGNKYQLDYILIRRKWRNSLQNAEAYNTFASVGSDHRIVSARIRLSLRKSKTLPRKNQFDWKSLSTDRNILKMYTIEVHNRFEILEDMEETATDKYSRFIAANKEAAEKIIPAKKRSRRANFSRDPRVIKARDHIRETYEEYQLDTTDCKREEYKKAKKNLDDAYNEVIEADLNGKLQEVERAHVNSKHGESWKLINDITGRKACSTGQLKEIHKVKGPPDIDDEEEEITPVLDELDIKVGPFDKEEYEEAKASLVEGKSCGEDNIPPEVLKRCNLDDIVLGFCNDALLKGKKPDQWSILNIVPIPKTGDLSSGNNYRGISLTSIVAKTYNRMILNRIRPEIDQHLRTNQNGFRVGRTTVGHILALRRLIEEVKAHNLPAIITFIDFKKAFDTIHRGKMLKILHAYGIPELIVEAIGNMYQNTKAKVISPDGETELFEILAGVLQGDTLAPYLFVIVLDFALRIAIEGNEEELGFHLEKRRSRRLVSLRNDEKFPHDGVAITLSER
ncbi:uncharacterized protein [Amphiura filiformis]|uniref:uncharacterized protein n=1 Tax=Amphiura filiformis TaxID=82378 RepID=UPI003B222C3D